MAVSKCPCLTFSATMSCLDVKMSLAPSNQLIVPSVLLAPATHIRTDNATKPQRYIRLDHWHMSYFFQNSSKRPWEVMVMKIFTSRQYSDLFMTYIFHIGNNLRELLPTKYRKCISFFFSGYKIWNTTEINEKAILHWWIYVSYDIIIWSTCFVNGFIKCEKNLFIKLKHGGFLRPLLILKWYHIALSHSCMYFSSNKSIVHYWTICCRLDGLHESDNLETACQTFCQRSQLRWKTSVKFSNFVYGPILAI